MPSILITGGAGYIGSHTTVALLEAGYTPVIVDNFYNSNPGVLDGIEHISGVRPKLYTGDCANVDLLETIFSENTIDGIIHFSALKSVGESLQKPLEYYRNNIGTLLSVLETAQKYDSVRAFVFSSSATVYGEPDTSPIPETANRKPAVSPYGNTKQIGEDIIRDTTLAKGGHLRAISLRYFNPIGAHPSGLIGELPIGAPNNLVPYLTQAVAKKRPPLTVFGNDYPTPDGTCIRDYIHVVDLANAHVATLRHLLDISLDNPPYAVYNVGTGKGTSVQELITTFETVNDLPVPHTIGKRRPGDVISCWADASQIQKDLGWHSTLTLKDALRDAWKWENSLQGTGDRVQ